MAQFGDLLAELRQDKKMTQKQLADAIFVTTGTISNYENNVHFPDVEKLLALADFFNVTTDYLLGRTNYDFPIDILNEAIMPGKTYGELIADIRDLTPERRQGLLLILQDMKMVTFLKAYDKRMDK